MTHPNYVTADLFVPGRASFVTKNEDGTYGLKLSQSSEQRSKVAAAVFNPVIHEVALFAGGYPGVAQNWPPEMVPPIGHREADLMAEPLMNHLAFYDWTNSAIDQRVLRQGESNNTIGDIRISIEKGLLDPNTYHSLTGDKGIEIVAGALHGARIKDILVTALDINPALIYRVPMHDFYSSPATEFRPAENAVKAVAKEAAAIGITKYVLRDVRPGNIDDLAVAEERLKEMISKISS